MTSSKAKSSKPLKVNEAKNCRDCKQDYKNDHGLVMYKENGCPVFYRVCDPCMKKRWMNFWGESGKDLGKI